MFLQLRHELLTLKLHYNLTTDPRTERFHELHRNEKSSQLSGKQRVAWKFKEGRTVIFVQLAYPTAAKFPLVYLVKHLLAHLAMKEIYFIAIFVDMISEIMVKESIISWFHHLYFF